jgi:chorismate dehydratase
MKFGTIPFVNMAPYYHFLSSRWLDEHQVVSGNPRQLGALAKTNKLDAAPFSYVDGMELVSGGEFEWLDSMGIAGYGPIRSILLVGAASPKDLAGRSVAVSPQTATTVRLMEVLLRQKHGIGDFQMAPPEDPTPFRLLIGDEALRRKLQQGGAEPQMDLSEEWTQWTGKPFVFARWAVRKSLPLRDRMRLAVSVRSALELSLGDLEDVSRAQSERTGLPQAELMAYLKAIRFNLGPAELAGADAFAEKLGLT